MRAETSEMQDFTIKFDGETNLITANTLINSLLHFTSIVESVNQEIDDTKKVEIKIKAHKQGSFVVDLVLSAQQSITDTNLLSHETVGYVKDLINVVSNVYKVAKFLKGKKPKNVETNGNVTTIENQNGTINNFDLRGANIYLGNKHIKEAFVQSFETLEQDTNVTGLELLDKDKNPIIEIKRDEFLDLSIREEEPIDIKTERIKPVHNAIISTFSFDWGLKKKWDFYYEGHKISVKIQAENLLESIEKGQLKFSKGDCLLVDLDIKQQFDTNANTYINVSYTLTRFIKHLPREEQSKMDLK